MDKLQVGWNTNSIEGHLEGKGLAGASSVNSSFKQSRRDGVGTGYRYIILIYCLYLP